ncbi:uncharacterized protein [Aegilops tauschii subsp. strangulata]|uniref:uncharacterized protein n=1 Tax=Aegilops tauschii subsp. strangulata TaxID=200361 RepID=UPI003CC87749
MAAIDGWTVVLVRLTANGLPAPRGMEGVAPLEAEKAATAMNPGYSEIAMAFGSKRKLADRSDIEEDDADDVDLINSDGERNSAEDASDEQDESVEHGTAKPAKSLLDEHFFGVGPGKTKQIARCSVASDRVKYKKIYDKYHQPEKVQASSSVSKKQLVEAFARVERDAVDMQIMMFLCANGIPFNVLRSPQYYEMVAAIQRAPKGYKPPAYEKARTTLLDACKRKVENDLAPVRQTCHGSMFLYAEDFSGEEKTGEAIAQFLLQAIEEIGPSNVLQVITDNASNCRVAGEEIQRVHKHIFWSPCVVHTLNLVFKDFAKKFAWMVDTYQTGKAIVKFFRSHQHFQDLFRRNSKLDLLKVSKTRFASHYIFLKRLMDVREALTTTIVTSKWKELVKACDVQTRAAANAIAQNIIDETFWDEIKIILDITKPLYMIIKFSDGEGPKSGDIYEKWTICLYYDQAYLASPAPGGGQRKAPNDDSEVMEGVIEALNRIAEDKKEMVVQLWLTNSNFNEVAKKVLSQPISSSSAERNWSTYSFIHNVKRNKLNATTADKLVFIHANERLKRRFSEGYNSGPHYKWDVEPENDLLEDSSLNLEQLRWDSLEDEAADAEPPRKIQRT